MEMLGAWTASVFTAVLFAVFLLLLWVEKVCFPAKPQYTRRGAALLRV